MIPMEKAARAVDDLLSDAFHESRSPNPRDIAKAVLLAVREPGMMALTAVFDAADDYAEVGPQGVWEAGIDAILADHSS